MEVQTQPAIMDVQRMDGGVLISFEDGRNAYYSPALLYQIMAQAHELHIPEDLDDDTE